MESLAPSLDIQHLWQTWRGTLAVSDDAPQKLNVKPLEPLWPGTSDCHFIYKS